MKKCHKTSTSNTDLGNNLGWKTAQECKKSEECLQCKILKRLGRETKGLNYAMGNEEQVEPIRYHEGKQEQDTILGVKHKIVQLLEDSQQGGVMRRAVTNPGMIISSGAIQISQTFLTFYPFIVVEALYIQVSSGYHVQCNGYKQIVPSSTSLRLQSILKTSWCQETAFPTFMSSFLIVK